MRNTTVFGFSAVAIRRLLIVVGLISAVIFLLTAQQAQAQAKTPRQIADAAAKAVIGITSMTQWGDELSEGSGFFIDTRGAFVTNYHVLEDAFSLVVELPSGERFTNISLLYQSPEHDLAILRVDAGKTEYLELAPDRQLTVGDSIYVMGNPLGQSHSFSNGIVSAWRTLEGVRHLQMTAPISPGSSGGPVMDSQGHVVGVATAYFEGGQNMNLAVPISYLKAQLDKPPSATPFQGKRVQPVAVHPAPPPGLFGQPKIEMKGDDWERLVRSQLREMEQEVKKEGFIRSHQEYVSELDDWSNALVSISLERGAQYLVGAVCDADCTDLDIFIYDGNNKLLAEESEVTDVPMMDFMPRYTGPHFLRVRMAECLGEPCTFGLAVWRLK